MVANEKCVNFEFLNSLYIDQKFAVFNKVRALLQQYECVQFGIFAKAYFKLVARNAKIWKP